MTKYPSTQTPKEIRNSKSERRTLPSRRSVHSFVIRLFVLPWVFGYLGILTFFTTAASHVLFIAVDDLRPTLGCYGDKTAITPNIDELAKRGTAFTRAHCQLAVCSPSRLSLLTGLRPDTIKVWDLKTHFRKAKPKAVTLPQLFKQNGYHTQSIGKIFHGSGKPSKDPASWSKPPLYDYVREPTMRYANPANLAGKGLKRAASESADVPDNTYADGIVCDEAVKALQKLKATGKPFFLAVGFRKPHLPFCAPKRYWDLYDRQDIPAPASNTHPEGAPELATRSWRELEGYTDIPEDAKISPAKVQELRHGYYACVSYVDAQIGRLLRHIPEDTIVVLWGDHGFHLGEQGLWTKANNYELSTCVPLIVSIPGQKLPGAKARGLVELVDVYPTLAEVCGLAAPRNLEGTSFKPLMDDPKRLWKKAVFSQYPRAFTGHRHKSHGDVMGYAIRTETHRYVEWREWKSKKIIARELYDQSADPNEMTNVATTRPGMIQQLSERLRNGWKAALPR